MHSSAITEVQIHLLKANDGLIGFASLVIDESWFVGNLAVYTRLDGGYRVVFPTKRLRNDQEVQIFHPISKEAGMEIESAITDAVNNLLH